MILSPLPIQKFFDNNGRPLDRGLLFTYVAGTSTKIVTYTDSTGVTSNTNPIELDFRGECEIWIDQSLSYKFILSPPGDTDPPTNPIWTVDNISYPTLSQAQFNSLLAASPPFARTAKEIAAGITPVNYFYFPGNVHRYGASLIYNSVIDDLQFFNSAIAALGPSGGKVTGVARTYQINGTLDITTLISFDFGTSNDGGAANGFILFSNTNFPIVRFNGGARFCDISNISIVGTAGGGLTAQHGIVINNAGIRLRNFVIRACGGNGIDSTLSYSGSYRDGYISLCDGSGIRVHGGSGGNIWDGITCAGNAGRGFNIDAADGQDTLIGCDSETNTGAGIYLGNGVIGWHIYGQHSELNVGGSLVFEVASNRNKVNFATWGDSAGVDLDPVNNGGTDNSWSGLKFASGGGGFNSGYIEPKLMQRVYMEVSAVFSGTPNATPFDDTIPQNTEGANFALILSIVPKRIGNLLHIKAWGNHSGHLAGVMAASLFKDSEVGARAVSFANAAIDDSVPFLLEYQFITTSMSSTAWAVNNGCNAAGLITLNGVNGARKFGGIAISGMEICEYLPNS